MKLSICVAGHPKRLNLIRNLAQKLDLTADRLQLDIESKGCYENMKKAWINIQHGATHQLVIQDDVIICDKFRETVSIIVDRFPDKKIFLFNHITKGDELMFIQSHAFFNSQCVVMPVDQAYHMIRWDHEALKDTGSEMWDIDDVHWCLWEIANHIKPIMVSPSIAQHLFSNKSKSLIKNSKSAPYSKTFIGENADGTSIDWRGALVKKRFNKGTIDGVLKAYGEFLK